MSEFVPATIPSGVTDINGLPYMTDSRGALVPIDVIKPVHKLEDETVRKVMGFALALSEQVERFKAHTMGDLAGLDRLLEQEHGFTKAGNKGKGNRTYMSYDGLYKVTVQIQDYIDFGPQLQVAKALVDECLNEWAADAPAELRAFVTQAFNTDQAGKINRADIFMLLRFEITDERWLRACAAIREAIRVVGSKEYVRFAMRAQPTDDWTAVTINLAKA